jgi:YVTN family beta-propeller protein
MRLSHCLLIGLAAAGGLLSLNTANASEKHARPAARKAGKAALVPGYADGATLLFNGWRIRPAGRHHYVGDMLLGGALSPDGKTLAIANAGFGPHALHLFDIATEREIATLPLKVAWNGLAWAPNGQRIYVAGGVSNPDNAIYVFERDAGGKWTQGTSFKLTGNDPKTTCIAGLALSADGSALYALNNSDNHLYVLDTTSGAIRTHLPVGDHPIVCKLSADGKQLYIANIGGSEVAVFDVSQADAPTLLTRIPTGEHPNDLALSHDDRLFVTCGNADAVTVYDLRANAPLETIKTSLTPNAPAGSTPNALALSPDDRTLYVANADNNDLCVIDVSRRGRSAVRGFIPTGWYPSAVHLSPDGKKLIVGSGKGTGTQPNPAKTPINPIVPDGFQYIGEQLHGLISFVDVPTEEQLADYTRQVYANTPYNDTQVRQARSDRKTAIPTRVGAPSPIKYVLYIIKENRTYDQVLGDMGRGNCDPNLTLFGKDVTPNHHALAEQFVLLDNLYCSGEVSQDGHPWSTSALVTDFVERSWILGYSDHGDTVMTDSVEVPTAGYIWDACRRKGLTYRSYGEYFYATSSKEAPVQKEEGAKGLIGHGSGKYVGVGRPKDAPPMRDMEKADVFIEEFKQFERTNTIPRFMVMSLGEDHTRGTTPGAFTPKASVGSNDQALGKIVEAISHSRVWKEFAIFVIQDDAQNGPDHVDSHRTVGLVISPYVRRGALDSTQYTTCSMLRTMELILGLPPLSQYDASATPMFACFTDKPDLTPYNLVGPRISLDEKNTATAYGAAESAQMDWSDYDRVDEQALNRILWHSIKGRDVPMPAPVRRALASANGRLHAALMQGDKED